MTEITATSASEVQAHICTESCSNLSEAVHGKIHRFRERLDLLHEMASILETEFNRLRDLEKQTRSNIALYVQAIQITIVNARSVK